MGHLYNTLPLKAQGGGSRKATRKQKLRTTCRKQGFPDIAALMPIWTHRDYESIHKISVRSNQIKSQRRKGEVGTKPAPHQKAVWDWQLVWEGESAFFSAVPVATSTILGTNPVLRSGWPAQNFDFVLCFCVCSLWFSLVSRERISSWVDGEERKDVGRVREYGSNISHCNYF